MTASASWTASSASCALCRILLAARYITGSKSSYCVSKCGFDLRRQNRHIPSPAPSGNIVTFDVLKIKYHVQNVPILKNNSRMETNTVAFIFSPLFAAFFPILRRRCPGRRPCASEGLLFAMGWPCPGTAARPRQTGWGPPGTAPARSQCPDRCGPWARPLTCCPIPD